jgi:hypothetical protein
LALILEGREIEFESLEKNSPQSMLINNEKGLVWGKKGCFVSA